MDLSIQNLALREKKLAEKQDQWEKDLNLREKNLAQRAKKLAEELVQWEKNLDRREQNMTKKPNLRKTDFNKLKIISMTPVSPYREQSTDSRALRSRRGSEIPVAVDSSGQKKKSFYSDDDSGYG
ncbi:centrosome-associated protein 350-like isoform X2 [Pygocentrus nattereri]|nr:centrosome-associated protein 350-like isoform X2 [Pygocentrus nattereri]